MLGEGQDQGRKYAMLHSLQVMWQSSLCVVCQAQQLNGNDQDDKRIILKAMQRGRLCVLS